MALSKEDREFITLSINIVEGKVDGINSRLDKINGRVSKTEDKIEEALTERSKNREHQQSESDRLDKAIENIGKIHILNCPNTERIIQIEKENFGKKEIVKFIIGGITIASVVILIVLNLEKLLFGG